MTTDHEMRMEALRLFEENEKLKDLLRNIAGLDDSNLFISSHAVLVAAVREWRAEARKVLGELNEDPSGQRREPMLPDARDDEPPFAGCGGLARTPTNPKPTKGD